MLVQHKVVFLVSLSSKDYLCGIHLDGIPLFGLQVCDVASNYGHRSVGRGWLTLREDPQLERLCAQTLISIRW